MIRKEESNPSSQPIPLELPPHPQQKISKRIINQLPPQLPESQQELPQCVAAKSLILVPPKLVYTL